MNLGNYDSQVLANHNLYYLMQGKERRILR